MKDNQRKQVHQLRMWQKKNTRNRKSSKKEIKLTNKTENKKQWERTQKTENNQQGKKTNKTIENNQEKEREQTTQLNIIKKYGKEQSRTKLIITKQQEGTQTNNN